MALNSIDGSLGGGLLPIAKASRRKLVFMQGEYAGFKEGNNIGVQPNAWFNGVRANGSADEGDTSFTVDQFDATTRFTVGDRIYRGRLADGHLAEIGVVTSVSATEIGVSAGIQTVITNNDYIHNSGFYNISEDGEITLGTNTFDLSADDLVINSGAGRIVVYGVDERMGTDVSVNQRVDRNGTMLSMEFTFGNEKDLNSNLNLVSAVGSFGIQRTGGTLGQGEADFLVWGYPVTVSGNTAVFNIGAMYEQEGGVQTNLTDDSILLFSVMAIADDGGGV